MLPPGSWIWGLQRSLRLQEELCVHETPTGRWAPRAPKPQVPSVWLGPASSCFQAGEGLEAREVIGLSPERLPGTPLASSAMPLTCLSVQVVKAVSRRRVATAMAAGVQVPRGPGQQGHCGAALPCQQGPSVCPASPWAHLPPMPPRRLIPRWGCVSVFQGRLCF